MTTSWKAKSPDLIMMALKNGPKHGYDIIKYLEDRSKGYFSLGYGSLYPILHSLEKEGLIAGEWEAAGPTKEKKIYKLTTKGRKSLEAISSEYKAFVGAFKLLLEG
jgi:PadR family transcriptional regulator PadR